jgi:DNA-binding MarR family transcriptional regulator
MSTDGMPGVPVRLGYLLKHVGLRYAERSTAALAPFGIDARELATLACFDAVEPRSQQQAAQLLGIDRTTMVALVDALEAKGLVLRSPHPADRRKNAVQLTASGRDTRARATAAADDAEREFLAGIGEEEARRLEATLRALLG